MKMVQWCLVSPKNKILQTELTSILAEFQIESSVGLDCPALALAGLGTACLGLGWTGPAWALGHLGALPTPQEGAGAEAARGK